jgi:hypothetical protein
MSLNKNTFMEIKKGVYSEFYFQDVIQQMMYATENMDPPSEYTRFLLKAKH